MPMRCMLSPALRSMKGMRPSFFLSTRTTEVPELPALPVLPDLHQTGVSARSSPLKRCSWLNSFSACHLARICLCT